VWYPVHRMRRSAPAAAARRVAVSRAREQACAAAALIFYAVYAGHRVWRGQWEDVLWVCHLANLVIAAGFLFAWPRAFGVALMWLVPGTACWAAYVLSGGEFLPTSLLTHVGGLLLAVIGCTQHGIRRRTWATAAAGLVGAEVIAHLLTSPEANVNVAWRVFEDWRRWFPSYPAYIVVIDAAAALVFWIIETLWRRRWHSSTMASGPYRPSLGAEAKMTAPE
jgi:hypothetical protein